MSTFRSPIMAVSRRAPQANMKNHHYDFGQGEAIIFRGKASSQLLSTAGGHRHSYNKYLLSLADLCTVLIIALACVVYRTLRFFGTVIPLPHQRRKNNSATPQKRISARSGSLATVRDNGVALGTVTKTRPVPFELSPCPSAMFQQQRTALLVGGCRDAHTHGVALQAPNSTSLVDNWQKTFESRLAGLIVLVSWHLLTP